MPNKSDHRDSQPKERIAASLPGDAAREAGLFGQGFASSAMPLGLNLRATPSTLLQPLQLVSARQHQVGTMAVGAVEATVASATRSDEHHCCRPAIV